MTKLFQDLMGALQNKQEQKTQGTAKDFVNEASKQGFTMSVPDFFRFAKMAKGKDMGQVVHELRESGDIDENLFQQLKQKASGFLNLLKMVTGK